MIPEKLQESIILITSSEPDENQFGTGFVIHQSGSITYILTCTHVIEDVGGSNHVQAEGLPAIVVAMGEKEGLDLAVLSVDGLPDKSPLHLQGSGEKGHSFLAVGFQLLGENVLSRPLQGELGNQVILQSKQSSERILAWDLHIHGDYKLQPGYSGSPVVDEKSGQVLAVVSYRQGEGEKGLAISINSLEKIWQIPDKEQLYRNLLKLGYRQQARLFRRVINAHDVAAFLIHGSPGYGQQWLLNRLVVQHLPSWITGKPIKIRVNRRVRRSDPHALWRELAAKVGLRGKPFTLDEIAERVYQCWQTQNILLIFHDVDFMSEDALSQLIQEFWLPLITKVKASLKDKCQFKLLMFLIDYDGRVANWNLPFVEKLDSSWKPDKPIKAPRINEFREEELTQWMENEYIDLPHTLTQEIDQAVEQILDNSDEGIPEDVFREICYQCGVDWYEESEHWLKL